MVRKSELPVRREDACVVRENGKEYCLDPLDGVLSTLSRRWTLLIVGVLGNKNGCRFNDLKRFVPGITARAVAERVEDLQRLGLVERVVDASRRPPAVSYHLTGRGRTLRRALIPMVQWAGGGPVQE